MSRIRRKKILLASVLNPVDHVRIYYREAMSLANAGYDIHIYGNSPTQSIGSTDNITFHIHPVPKRFSLERALSQNAFRKVLKNIQPDILHIHTPELILEALKWKNETGNILIYDRHEAYPLQTLNPKLYPFGLNYLLPKWIKYLENKIDKKAAAIIVAEAGYLTEYPWKCANVVWIRNSCPSLENIEFPPFPEKPYLLIAGNLDPSWGLLNALKIWEKYFQSYPLIIAGYCPQLGIRKELNAWATKYKSIQLIGINSLIPWIKLMGWMKGASGLLAPFPDQPFLRGKMPSRFYEAGANGIPIIAEYREEWFQYWSPYDMMYTPEQFAALPAIPTPSPPSDTWSWELDAQQLLNLYEDLDSEHQNITKPV